MSTQFWKNKRVFITGHTGFKGSWMTLWLKRLGAEITGYSLKAEELSLFQLANVHKGIESIEGDIRDLKQLTTSLQKAQPDIVFHMAAQPLVRYSYQHPVETYETNVMGTVHMLEAVRQTLGIQAVVVVTSDKCYQNTESNQPFQETDSMGGNDPYSSSKGSAELATAAYRHSYFKSGTTAIASARAGNVIGGGDWATDRLIPDMMRSFAENQVVEIRNPTAIRPWQHVLEPLNGYLLLAEQLVKKGQEFAQGWNFGPDNMDAKSVEWVVERIVKLWEGSQWKKSTTSHPHEAHTLILDCTKAKKLLGWKPLLTLPEALEMTVSWYREYKNTDIRSYTETQINAYETRLQTNPAHII